MPQNGPPSQPWSAGGPEQPYREPADPWGDQPDADHLAGGGLWGGNPSSVPPGAAGPSTGYDAPGGPDPGYAGYPATGTYSPAPGGAPPAWAPTSAPGRGPGLPIIALVAVLGLLICGGLGTAGWLLVSGDPPADAAKDPAATPSSAQTAADVNPAPRSSNDARFVTKGQCVRNDGTATKPQMSVTECTAGTYQVLARVDGPTTGEADAEAKCAKVPQYTKWFFYDSELDSLDFVLCLRER